MRHGSFDQVFIATPVDHKVKIKPSFDNRPLPAAPPSNGAVINLASQCWPKSPSAKRPTGAPPPPPSAGMPTIAIFSSLNFHDQHWPDGIAVGIFLREQVYIERFNSSVENESFQNESRFRDRDESLKEFSQVACVGLGWRSYMHCTPRTASENSLLFSQESF